MHLLNKSTLYFYRFSAENKSSIQPCTFLPFGFGPRNCIGMRFALLVAKMALVRVLQQYRFDVCSETEVSIQNAVGLFYNVSKIVNVGLKIVSPAFYVLCVFISFLKCPF